MSTLGKNIKKRREELGITQEELANKLGYKSKSTINKIENGTNDIPQSKISAFASALDTTEGKLMGWNEEERLEKARQEIFEDEDMKLLFNLKKDAQVKIDCMKEDCEQSDLGDCYSEDGMKEIIVDWMDELGIYPNDLDRIMSELEF